MTNSTPLSPSSSMHSTTNNTAPLSTKTHSAQSSANVTSTSSEKWSFSALKNAAKRVASPSMSDRSTSDGLAAMLLIQMSPAQMVASPSATSATGPTVNATSTTTALTDMTIDSNGCTLAVDPALKDPFTFTTNIDRTPQVPVIGISQPFITTVQLVHYNHLLRILELPSSSLSSTAHQPVIDELKLSKGGLEWIEKVKTDTVEQARIRNLVVGLVNEFILLPFKDLESIREIVLVAPVLDKTPYQALLRCFLAEFDKQGILAEEMLQGLVQIVEDAPPEYLEVDNLIKILDIIRVRLDDTASQSSSLLFQLTQALSRVLSVMADQHVKDLDRVKSHQPVNLALSAFKGADNPFLRFQAMYALQALRCVPDNETPVQCFFRHFVKVTNDVVQISRVMQMDFSGFVEGAVEIQKSIKDIYDIAKDGLDDFLALKEDGKSAIQALLGSKELSSWFICLRAAEEFVAGGRLVELSQCINEAPGHINEYFQWGACQLLTEIAGDSSWDSIVRSQAVDYLGRIYSTTQHQNIKRWILTLLDFIFSSKTIDTSSEKTIKSEAATLFQRLAKDDMQPFPFPYISRQQLLLPISFSLLQKVNKIPDVEPRLHVVRSRIRDSGLAIYVPLMCKENLQASSTENLRPLEETVSAFLGSQHEVLLILGDSGAGKSTFNRHLEHKLWNEYQPGGGIPLFIDLKAMGNLNEIDFVQKKLEQYDFEDQEIREVKRSRQVILICDGYDECRQLINLHSRLKSDLGWKSLKLMITCRTQYLASMSDRIYFEPQEDGENEEPTSQLYDEIVIVPFKDDQVRACIDQFRDSSQATKVFDGEPIWSTEQYLEQLANLMGLVKNPFMLQIALRTLPGMTKDDGDLSKIKLTRFDLYDKFTKQHFDNEKKRLSKEVLGMDSTFKRAFAFLQVNFPLHCMGFSKRLSHMVFVKNGGVNSIEYSTSGEDQGWKDMFFGLEVGEKVVLLKQSSQLISYTVDGSNQSNDSEGTTIMHQFPHRSILEFLYSCQLCDHLDSTAFSKFFDTTTKYNNLATCLAATADPLLLLKHPFNQQNIISESSILGFLADHAKTDLKFQDQLNTIIQRSKSDKNVSQAAANAITILVRAGHRFNNRNLRGIQIRGANLTGGQFDGTQLQGADLKDCILRNTWLRQADLSDSDMENVVFGEWPYVQEDDWVMCCAFSSNGEMFACGFVGGTVKVYDTSTWMKLYTIDAHTDRATTVGFSSDGLQIASGSSDCTVRLWDAQTGTLEWVLEDQENMYAVNCLVYSPNGKQVASAGNDKKVRIWDTQTGEACMVWDDQTHFVNSMAYSPDGQQIVSGSSDSGIRIWNVKDGSIQRILESHTDQVTSVVYSPGGDHIVSGSKDQTVRLWNALTGELEHVLEGHSADVNSVAFSPTGQQIASGGYDQKVRLWDARSGGPGAVMEGHSDVIGGLAYSPDGQKIVSTGYDKTIRIWAATQITSTDPVFHGHTGFVDALIFSSNGHQVASSTYAGTIQIRDTTTGALISVSENHDCYVYSVSNTPSGLQFNSRSYDGTIQLWDASTGDPGLILKGHRDCVSAFVYAPNGQQIASGCNDWTVRLWDAQTGEPIWTSTSDFRQVVGIVFSPTGQQIASWGYDGAVELWNVETGQPGHVLGGSKGFVKNAVYSPSGEHVAVLSDGDVWLWDAQTGGQILKDLLETNAGSIAYSPSGQLIAIGCLNGEVRLWDTQTGAMAQALIGHTQKVKGVTFSPNSQWIATFSEDRSLRLWDAQSNVCLAVIGFVERVESFVWNARADGTFFAVSSDVHDVSIFEVVEVDGLTTVQLRWTTSETRLHASSARIQNVHGLTEVNRQLLKQRGAVVDESIDA